MFLCLFIMSCSEGQVEEFAFRKTLELSLVKACEEDQECATAVKSQISDCMEKSDWRKYLQQEESEEALNRFTKTFYSCIVDSEGNPYFEVIE